MQNSQQIGNVHFLPTYLPTELPTNSTAGLWTAIELIQEFPSHTPLHNINLFSESNATVKYV